MRRKGCATAFQPIFWFELNCEFLEITEDITVYRFSPQKVVEYLRVKVERLSTPKTIEVSRTLVRNLAKDGLMEDGKENLLEGQLVSVRCI
jgi:ribonuclease H2 subunit B